MPILPSTKISEKKLTHTVLLKEANKAKSLWNAPLINQNYINIVVKVLFLLKGFKDKNCIIIQYIYIYILS